MLRLFINPYIRIFSLFCVLALLLLSVSGGLGVKNRISNIVFETYIKIYPRQSSGQIVFVDIDDKSLSKVGQWPWPRTRLAEIIRNLKADGAAVIVFDGVIAEPDRTSPENVALMLEEGHPARAELETRQSHDSILSQAIHDVGNFVTGFSFGSNEAPPLVKRRMLVKREIKDYFLGQKGTGSLYFKTTSQFLPELQKSAAGNGSFMATSEGDAVIRRTGIIFHDGNALYPSLVLEALRLYENQGKEYIKIAATKEFTNYKIQEPITTSVGRYNIPTDADGKMWVYFRNFQKDERAAAYKFLNQYRGVEKTPNLKNKVVFIGSSAEGLMDLRSTPIGLISGVYVHINAFEQILQQRFIIRPPLANDIEVWGAVGVAILLILMSLFISPLWLALITISVCIGTFGGSWYAFIEYGGLFDPVTPSIMIILMFIVSTILSFLKTEYERSQVSDAFGHYISPDFMKELTKSPDKLRLGGEMRDLSVLFSDIRSFTSISEGLTPEELIQLMNDFLTPMSDLVMKNRGTIDKYMGDAMMAFWNAPLDDSDHARNACLTALSMQKALDPINKSVKEKALELGKEPILLRAGIGVNTGPCAVGNMGSKQRFAYSALGDAVNLASRLEGQTKTYGVNILVGEDTKNKTDDLAFLEVDLLQVQGRKRPVHVFVLLGDEEYARTHAFKKWSEAHQKMLEAYRSRAFEDVGKIAMSAQKLSDGTLDVVYDLYKSRAKEMIKIPPKEDWDGVFTATSK